MITPLFRSTASIGKSILTSALPDPKREPDNADSIFDLIGNRKEIYVLETTMVNVFELLKNSKKLGVELRYGLEFKVGADKDFFKQSFFAINAQGVRDLMELYSKVEVELGGFLPEKELPKLNCDNLHIFCNFYDGWIHRNLMAFGTFMPQFPKPPIYQIESNNLPIDHLITKQIKKDDNRTLFRTKSILYKNRDDVDAFLIYKLSCEDRQGGKRPTFISPNLDGFASREFCYESFLEQIDD